MGAYLVDDPGTWSCFHPSGTWSWERQWCFRILHGGYDCQGEAGCRMRENIKVVGCGKLFCLCDVYWLVVSVVCVCVGGSEADELPALFCGVSLQITETRA